MNTLSDTQRLPNLYQLLGLQGPESNREKIVAALKRAQAKVESLKADSARASDAARLQKVIALGQKYLLPAEQKAAYDAQWNVTYGSATKPTNAAVSAEVVATATSTHQHLHRHLHRHRNRWAQRLGLLRRYSLMMTPMGYVIAGCIVAQR